MKILSLLLALSLGTMICAQEKVVAIYTTAERTDQRIARVEAKVFTKADQPLEQQTSVFVNPKRKFQSFIGIGGAITDASAEVFAKLSPQKQEELLNAYYSEEGNNYKIIRTSIHSADFGSGSFTYIDEGDTDLSSFSIDHDKQYRLPMIKRALAKIGDNYMFYASPWSPPAFMKSNNSMLEGGKLLPEYCQSWANYYVKFIQAYEKEGIKVWGVTVQNEPMAVQSWESCIYTAEEERDFVRDFLGPTFERNGLEDKNIVIWDHNRDLVSHRANVVLEDKEASKYIWGIGFHWYETWAGGEPKWDNLRNVKESFPDKNLLFTEGCQEGFDRRYYYRWGNAERYGESMINDFNAGTVGWTDWNILLNENGGPNHVQNFCFAPIHADIRTGQLIYTPIYYYIGHFSRFIDLQAKRISTSTSHTKLLATSFCNPNGEIVSIVMNKTDKAIKYNYIVSDMAMTVTIVPHAIQTLVF